MTPSLRTCKSRRPEWRRKQSKPIRGMMIHMYPTLFSRPLAVLPDLGGLASLAACKPCRFDDGRGASKRLHHWRKDSSS